MKRFSWKKFFIGILTFLLISISSLFAVAYFYLNSINTETINKDNLNISDNKNLDKVINIALLGTDNRNPNAKSRTDSIMIATINTKTKKIKLSSIMRDSLVDIPGKGMDKINHAHAYGGPELTIRTLNSNFDLNISDYASVDFFSLAEIIDLLGGFEVVVSNNEAWAMNKAINELNRLEKLPTGTDYVYGSSEVQTLNGRQAVSYARIRKVGNGDYERTERQRRLLQYCIDKVQKLSLPEALTFIKEALPLINTSLYPSDIINLANKALSLGTFEVEQLRIPADGLFSSGRYNSMFVLNLDLEANKNLLHKFIQDELDSNEDSIDSTSNTEQQNDTINSTR